MAQLGPKCFLKSKNETEVGGKKPVPTADWLVGSLLATNCFKRVDHVRASARDNGAGFVSPTNKKVKSRCSGNNVTWT